MSAIDDILYPASSPYNEGDLKVDDLHAIHYAEHGNPKGIPIVYLHGGPGFGYSDYFHRFFDPRAFRIIVYDQRGAPRSSAPGEIRNNSPALLVEDNDKLRKHLGIGKWHVYGGSWGSALSLLYAEAYPENVLSLTLRGVWTMRKSELDWYFKGVRAIMPDTFDELVGFLPEPERGNHLESFYQRILNPDPAVHAPAAAAFIRYVACSGALQMPPESDRSMPPAKMLSICRIALNFMRNHFPTTAVWDNIDKIKHIPVAIVQGRYDALTPAVTAFELSKKFSNAHLEIVVAGHSAIDPEIMKGLVAATNRIRDTGSPVPKS